MLQSKCGSLECLTNRKRKSSLVDEPLFADIHVHMYILYLYTPLSLFFPLSSSLLYPLTSLSTPLSPLLLLSPSFSHSWADQLVPVIISAQFKLSNRLADHAQEMAASKKEKLQPAAHLDPGPDGYNIYGKMGHSLAITSVPLDIKTTLKRASDIRNSDEGEISLSKARSLLGRYCAAQLRQKTINDGSHGNGDIADSAEYDLADCPATPVVQVSIVVSAFDKAVTTLLNSGKKEGAAQAMSELGDLLWHCGQHKSAGRWWKEVLTTVARIQAPPSGWRKVLEAESVLSEFGVWGCLQSALNAAKLAR